MDFCHLFIRHQLDDDCLFFVGRLPSHLFGGDMQFSEIWELKPLERPWIMIHGKRVQIPRWQQAFGTDYAFSGQISIAAPIPLILLPFLHWAQNCIEPQLNGLLLNWYEGSTKDYIGPHHDKSKDLIGDAPIITISLGAQRTFRLTQGNGAKREVRDFDAAAGTAFILPSNTNSRWRHEVPHFARNTGRRISITLRAFRHASPLREKAARISRLATTNAQGQGNGAVLAHGDV